MKPEGPKPEAWKADCGGRILGQPSVFLHFVDAIWLSLAFQKRRRGRKRSNVALHIFYSAKIFFQHIGGTGLNM